MKPKKTIDSNDWVFSIAALIVSDGSTQFFLKKGESHFHGKSGGIDDKVYVISKK